MECGPSGKMVATLASRKEALEAKLREKSLELKNLCVREAELTGILPPETPIEPGESPPVFRRRVGTTFTYPASLVNKLKSHDEQTLAKLELECRIQTSIAEAALGLANDGNANKSIRRKHRLMYQQSQQRLAELEARLSALRRSARSLNVPQSKQRKKPRPPLDGAVDCVDSGAANTAAEAYDGFVDGCATLPSYNGTHFTRVGSGNGGTLPNTWNQHGSHVRRNLERSRHHSACGEVEWVTNGSPTGWRNTAPSVGYFSNQCYQAFPTDGLHTTSRDEIRCESVAAVRCLAADADGMRQRCHTSESAARRDVGSAECVMRGKSRYGSLDRRHRGSVRECDASPQFRTSNSSLIGPSSSYSRHSPCSVYKTVDLLQHTPYKSPPSPSSQSTHAVLLPSQVYPENSLIRTQSLGNVERRRSADTRSLRERQNGGSVRRTKEKEWRETALDAPVESYERRSHTPPLHPRASKIVNESPPPPHRPLTRAVVTPPPPPPPPAAQAASTATPPRSPVPVAFESPQNHTVVEVGMWQPYREVSKPFEMADFYKYSTKYRKEAPAEAKPNTDENAGDQFKNVTQRRHRPAARVLSENSYCR